MKKDGFKLFAFLLAFSFFAASSNALIEEKSSILGSVIGASNVPLAGITVRVLDSFFLSEVARTVTDRNGKFALSQLLPGLYLLSAESPLLPRLMKRVQVVSGAPTLIDLRSVLSEDELKKHDAWDKFKWTIRVAERNPLRDDQTPVSQTAATSFSSEAFAFFKNIDGELEYLNVGSGLSGSGWNRQMTQVAMQGKIERHGAWSVNGNVFDGPRSSYIASGDFRYRLSDHHVGASFSANDLIVASYPGRQLIRKFVDSADIAEISDDAKLWVTSVDLQDEWQLFPQITVDYGTRIDYYGYLQEPFIYSPRMEVSYHLTPRMSVRALYYRDQSAPGNYSLQPDAVRPYIHDVAFIPYKDVLNPETTVGYEAGLDLQNEDFSVSVFYRVENVANKIAAVDLKESFLSEELQTNRPFVVFNSSDLRARGVGAQVSKRISPLITLMGSYNVRQAIPLYIIEKRGLTGRKLFFLTGPDVEDFHDVQAGVAARIRQTGTQVDANWKWSSGTPLVFGGRNHDSSLSAIDVEVRQGVPVHIFSQTEVKLLLAIKNLLDQNADSISNADFERALLYNVPRTIAGGLAVRF